jgi:predicted enzyme related to lactoylglutathione lyase
MNDLLSFAGLVFYSPRPIELVAFYRDALGLPIEPAEHGTVGPHFEGSVGGTHVAFWGEERHMSGPLVPVFRTRDVNASGARLVDAGARQIHKPIDLGEGKRVAGFFAPDGRPIRLIEISDAPVDARSEHERPRGAVASAVSAVVFASRDQAATAAFFERGLGLRFSKSDHGGTRDHHEAKLGPTRFAIVDGASEGRGAVAPTFLVGDLDGLAASLQGRGVEVTSRLQIAPNRRLASFVDRDGNPFHAIQVS